LQLELKGLFNWIIFKKSGYYDEIIVGNGWNNLGSLNYIHDQFKGMPETPQVIITKRNYQVLNPSEINFRENVGLTSEIELLRKAGIDNINNWYEQGLKFPANWTE